jgi:transposase
MNYIPVSLAQKEQIKAMRQQGKSCPAIAKNLNLSLRVVHKWSAVCKNEGTLQPIRGRIEKGHMSTFGQEVVDKIIDLKGRFQDWGAVSIRAEMIYKLNFKPEQVPSISTLKRFLKNHQATKPYQKNTPLDAHSDIPKATKAHEIWQIDDQGSHYFKGIGHVGMINIKCPSSKTYVQPYPVYLAHVRDHLDTQDYQNALRLAFTSFGLPEQIQMDHGAIFYENASKSPFPTRLHLWLLGLGISCFWSRVHRPTDQGSVERCHRTILEQINVKDGFSDRASFEQVIADRHYALNHYYPEPSLSPFSNKAALHSGCFYDYSQEEQLFNIDNIYAYLSDKVWYRKVAGNHTVSLGGQVYYSKFLKKGEEVKLVIKNKRLVILGKECSVLVALKNLNFDTFLTPDSDNIFINRQLKLPFD